MRKDIQHAVAATALIRHLAWELPLRAGVALKRPKKKSHFIVGMEWKGFLGHVHFFTIQIKNMCIQEFPLWRSG